jgi:2-phosphosulfolactate phosphatase
VIDCFAESVSKYRATHVIVAIDVIRATTTAVTGASLGRAVHPVPTLDLAMEAARRLESPLMVGEIDGYMPFGFELNNSPTALIGRTDLERPAVLLSTSGTAVLWEARGAPGVYAACLRNFRAQAAHLSRSEQRVALIGAGSRGTFRDEDQLCCAWIADILMHAGFRPEDQFTRDLAMEWAGESVDRILESESADYLVRTGQQDDLDFIRSHVGDMSSVFTLDATADKIVLLGSGET